MEIIIWKEKKIPLLSHSHPASIPLQHRWMRSWISVHVLFYHLEMCFCVSQCLVQMEN